MTPLELSPGEDIQLEIAFETVNTFFEISLNQRTSLHSFELSPGVSSNEFSTFSIRGAFQPDFVGFVPPRKYQLISF